jgi:hypothetical protein
MKAIYSAIGKRMAESEQFATQPYVWALREATFLAIGYTLVRFKIKILIYVQISGRRIC